MVGQSSALSSGYTLPNEIDHKETQGTVMRATRFDEDGMLRLSARPISASTIMKENAALQTPFWAAGFSFSDMEMARLVPYDPDLPYLFFGEEICMTLRMWTSGFDFFAPLENVAYHLWSRNYRPTLDISSSEARAEAEITIQGHGHHHVWRHIIYAFGAKWLWGGYRAQCRRIL